MQNAAPSSPVRQGGVVQMEEGAGGLLEAWAGCETPSRLVGTATERDSPRDEMASGPQRPQARGACSWRSWTSCPACGPVAAVSARFEVFLHHSPQAAKNAKRFHKNGREGSKGARYKTHPGWPVQPRSGDLP